MNGRVLQINLKPRTKGEPGLPKRETAHAQLREQGFEGDYNLYRQEEKGGDPDMAVLLMPSETISELVSEGWPVAPGDIGENITSEGIAYADFTPGKKFKIGPAVIEISKACDPCRTLSHLPYVGPGKVAAFVKATLGRRGWYARVLSGGLVRKGDEIAPA